jgi:hypothetical protein
VKAARSTAPLSGGPGPQTGAAKLTVSFYIHSGVRSQLDCTSDPPGTGAGRLRPRPHIREFTPWGHGILIGLYCSPSGLVRNDWNPGILIELYFSPRDWCETIGIPSARYNLSQPCVAKGIKIQLKELPGLRAEDTIAYRHHQSL